MIVLCFSVVSLCCGNDVCDCLQLMRDMAQMATQVGKDRALSTDNH